MGDVDVPKEDADRLGSTHRFNWLGKESKTGEWVRAIEHEAYVANLRRQIVQLSARLAEANMRMVQAEERCEHLIAVMAAHGSVNAEVPTAQPKDDGPRWP